MKYEHPVCGTFLSRPNRFVARVVLSGREETVHVKNTGRCRELLLPGAEVWCQPAENPCRKTRFDLIAVEKGRRLINLDAQAPNAVAAQWLAEGGLGEIDALRPETVYGDSRFDFSFYKGGRRCFLEVKGVTLEEDGVCAFPDAPTQRGTKHLRGLRDAALAGNGAYVLFVIQMEGAKYLQPNDGTDPAFGQALRDAAAAGVQVLAVDCLVTPWELKIRDWIPVRLGESDEIRRS